MGGTRRGLPAFRFALTLAASVAIAPAARALDCTADTEVAMTRCAARDFARADAALNAAYERIVARLGSDPDTAGRLVAAQKAWIAFRDAECAFATGDHAGGSAAPMADAQCRARLTRARVRDFDAYLTCQEGDLLCPLPPRTPFKP